MNNKKPFNLLVLEMSLNEQLSIYEEIGRSLVFRLGRNKFDKKLLVEILDNLWYEVNDQLKVSFEIDILFYIK